MKILYFLEPSIEFGNPLFRYATLRNSLVPQIKALREAEHDVLLLTSSAIAEKAMEDGYHRVIPRIAAIDPIEWTAGRNSNWLSMRHQKDPFQAEEVIRLKGLIRRAMPDGFHPDTIVIWESPADFLREIFDNVRLLYEMPGFFSRPPFPSMISVNSGLLENSEDAEPIVGEDLIGEADALSRLRKCEDQFFKSVNPFGHLVREIRDQFSSVLLYPLQIDGYFMVDHVLGEGRSQIDVLIDTLNSMPKEQALWVTNYRSKDIHSTVLSDNNIGYLRRRFPNFVYRDEVGAVENASQYLVPELDGVITVSSSVGYQAAFWKKPLLALGGKSHISAFATATSLGDLSLQASAKSVIDRDPIVLGALRTQHLPVTFASSKFFAGWLEQFTAAGKLPRWTLEPVADRLLSERRESDTLQQLKYFPAIEKCSSPVRCRELSQMIKKFDIISFDIFDTLLQRPFKTPADMFDFMEAEARLIAGRPMLEFRSERQSAERAAFQAALRRGEGETTLSEIYDVLGINLVLEHGTTARIMALELSLERELLYPRVSGYNAFLEAKGLGRRIVLVSDMYLPDTFLEEVLQKNGYNGYDRLFVSSSYRVKKNNGKLYAKVAEDLGVDCSRILHVGDNVESDVKRAKERGMKPFHLVKASEVFYNSDGYKMPWARDEARHSPDWRMILAIIGNRLHDNPYAPSRKGRLFEGDPWRLGYYGFGPLLLGFAKWLLENARRDGIDRLYFLARDGEIIKNAFDRIAKLGDTQPATNYLLCSRRAVNVAKIQNEADILDLLRVDFAHRVPLRHLLKSRFGVNVEELPEGVLDKHGLHINSPMEAEKVLRVGALLKSIEPIILEVAREERGVYLEYLLASGLFDEGKVAVVDIGYAGTMQESLHQLSRGTKVIGGYYLMTFRPALRRVVDRDLPIAGYLANFIDRHDTYHPICRHIPLYETLFSSTSTSLVRMSRGLNGRLTPVFMEPTVSEATRGRCVSAIHRGALEFVDDAVRILGTRLLEMDVEPNKSLRVLNHFFENPHPRDAEIFAGLIFEDAYGGRNKLLLPGDGDHKMECVWPQGAEVMARDRRNREKAAQSSSASAHSGWSHKVITWIALRVLPCRKKRKFINNPRQFFLDSKSRFVGVIGRIYVHSTDVPKV